MLRRPISVLELAGYRKRADELLTVDEQDAVVDLIAQDPTCGDVIPGTGGLRKVRVGRAGMGKRGLLFLQRGFSGSAYGVICQK